MMSGQALAEAAAVDLAGTEALAVELATLAGHKITAAFGTIVTVRYKTGLQDRTEVCRQRAQIAPAV